MHVFPPGMTTTTTNAETAELLVGGIVILSFGQAEECPAKWAVAGARVQLCSFCEVTGVDMSP